MTPAEALSALANTALLGRGRRVADTLTAQVASGLASRPDPETARRLQAWLGILLFVDGRPGAVEPLLEAARRADHAGDQVEALRCRLYAVRALCAVGRVASASELLGQIEPDAAAVPALGGDLRLAMAAAGHPEPRRLWEEALLRLPTPARDLDRVEALLGLGVLARDGEDVVRARSHWRRGLEICDTHGDERGKLRFAALLGNLLLEAGQNAEAEAVLAVAVASAGALGDALVLLSEALPLCALQLGREDWASAERTAVLIEEAASRRNNLHALASAAIDRSTCRLAQGDTSGALRVLMDAAARLRERGSMLGLNVLKARLGELRIQLTPAVFDPLWQANLAARAPAAAPRPPAPAAAAPAPAPPPPKGPGPARIDKNWGAANKLKD